MPVGAKGQADLFFAAGSIDSGLVVNQDLDLTVNLGDTVSIYAFWSTNGPANSDLDTGAGFDFQTSQSGIIGFDSATTFDFDITVSDIVIGSRWETDLGNGFSGPAGSVTSDSIDDFNAFAVSGFGIDDANNGSGPFLDAGYDFAGDAFLFGEIEFTALEVGTVDIFTSAGSIGIVNNAQTVDASFGGISITVVPEPNSALIIASVLGMVGCARRRKLA